MADKTLKKFVTSAKNADEQGDVLPVGDPLPIQIDDREITLLPPTTSQFVLMLASMEAAASEQDQYASIINFFFGMIDDEDKRYIFARLRDRKDPFDVEDLSEIVEYVTEEWSARPTEESQDSSSPSQGSGKKSKAKPHHAAHRSGGTTSADG